MEPNLLDCVIHWKKKLDKYPDDQNIILNVIRKLSKIPITVEILEATHIGKTIRNLSKRDDTVGENAKAVLNKWRNIFINLESARNAKEKNISSKNTVDKDSNKHNSTQVKDVSHHKRESFDELKEKQKKHSSHHSSSKQSYGKNSNLNSSSKFSHSFNKTDMNHLDDMNEYDSVAGIISCNNLELALSYDKSPNSSDSEEKALKRKLTEEEKTDVSKNSYKKRKLETHSISSSEENKKFKIVVDGGESFFQNLKKEQSSPVKQSSSKHLKKVKNDDFKNKKKETVETEKSKAKVQSSDGFTSSSISFEDVLGFNDVLPVKKKKSSVSQCSTKKLHSDSTEIKKKSGKKITGESHNIKETDKAVSKDFSHSSKGKTSGNILKKSTMFDATKANSPSLSTFPLSQNQSTCTAKKESLRNEDVIRFTSSRKEKTAIYSGRKSHNKSFPTLAQCCHRVLIENIDILGPMFGTPYTLIKPVLEKCTPNQLFTIERYNPYLLDDTNELWEVHCKRDYKLLSPLEHETWRDVYLRGFDEHEERLKNIRANISASMLKAAPARQVKLAFIDSDAKPPRDVLRRQAKARLLESGTNVVKPVVVPKVNAKKTVTVPCSTVSSQRSIVDKNELVETKESLQAEIPNKNPSPKGNAKTVSPAIDPSASNKDIIALSLAAKKPKVAPLMAKTLKALKQSFRR